MRPTALKSISSKSGFVATLLLAAHGVAFADSNITLTAAPTTARLPDGQSVPMWGLLCGTLSGGTFTYAPGSVSGSPAATPCTTLTGGAHDGSWQPPLITVPSGGSLTITLHNQLNFGTTYHAPTSLVIVGLIGGGLGSAPTRTPSPAHPPQGTTWPGTLGGTNPGDTVFTPPVQLDRVRSFAAEVAPSASASLVWTATNLRPGTYLIESGTHPSIQGPMGLYGIVVVTDASYPGQSFDKDVPLLLSEIDPLQNRAVDQAVRTAGFDPAAVWSGQIINSVKQCGHPDVHTCFPPAVNYDPRYFLVNGVSFDRASASSSLPAVPASPATGNVLLRFVNAGLRMHVPSVVGADMTLLAEDGNKLPGVPKVQSALFLPAGKTSDVVIHPALATATSTDCSALPCYAPATYAVFDRALGLSANNQRDGGMQAYINVAGGGASGAVGSSASIVAAVARPDSYYLVAGNALTVAEMAKGAIANDTGVYGVQLLSGPTGTGSALTLNADGTFKYTPGSGVTSDSFSYCANGTVTGSTCSSGITATVTLAECTSTPDSSGHVCKGGAPTAVADTF
ncbi:MAG TPA: hypothetical protein VKB34_01590, partial [Povalibacter sp.]|nr:hypothetical protein [Povalibacter sp.]